MSKPMECGKEAWRCSVGGMVQVFRLSVVVCRKDCGILLEDSERIPVFIRSLV